MQRGGRGSDRGMDGGCRLQASIVDTGRYNRLLPITSNMSSLTRTTRSQALYCKIKWLARARGVPVHTLRIATPIPPDVKYRGAPVGNMMCVLLALSSKNYVFFFFTLLAPRARVPRCRKPNVYLPKIRRKLHILYTKVTLYRHLLRSEFTEQLPGRQHLS